MAATAHLTLVAPDNEKCTVQLAPVRLAKRKPNVTVTPTVVLHRLDQPLDPRYRATSRSSIQCATTNWHRLGSKAYSGTDCTMLWI
jgi:hypothetical protein